MYTRQKRQDWFSLLLGIWLFVTPMFTLSDLFGVAAWNGYIFGSIIALLSFEALYRPRMWEEWTNLAIGLWLVIAPFVLGYTFGSLFMWNSIIVGLLIAADALWAALSKTDPMRQKHTHPA